MNSTANKSAIATSVSNCESVAYERQVVRPPVLLDPALLKFLSIGVLCKVQLMSEELELDANEVAVPKVCLVIDLMVLDDSRATIELLIASTPEYQGYKVTDHSSVIDNENLF